MLKRLQPITRLLLSANLLLPTIPRLIEYLQTVCWRLPLLPVTSYPFPANRLLPATCYLLPVTCLLLSSCTPKKDLPPNVILILADDLGWSDPGFMGNTYHETPNLDRLASESMVFTRAYANAPNCAPTRACLLSGLYMPRHGVYTVNSSARGESRYRKLIPTENNTVLASDFITIGELFQANGYATASMGKWHLGDSNDTRPEGQGFALNVGGNHRGHPPSYFSPYKNPNLQDGPEGEHLTDRLTREAEQFITQNQDTPFFLYLPYYAVHTPLQGKEAYIAHFEEKSCDRSKCHPVYGAMVKSMDEGVGRLMQTLDSLQLRNNTIIVFLSDNGPYFPASTAEPLRGSKGMLYEGGIRVPMVVNWPGHIRANSRCETPVIGMDLYPSLIELAGLEVPAELEQLDGLSLTPLLLETDTLASRAIFWHFPAYLQGYKGMTRWRTTPAAAVQQDNWKLIEFFEDQRLELYDLEADEEESNNLATSHPEKVEALMSQMYDWRKRTGAPVPTERNPEYDPDVKEPEKR